MPRKKWLQFTTEVTTLLVSDWYVASTNIFLHNRNPDHLKNIFPSWLKTCTWKPKPFWRPIVNFIFAILQILLKTTRCTDRYSNDQIGYYVSFLILYSDAVGREWPLLGSPCNIQAMLYIYIYSKSICSFESVFIASVTVNVSETGRKNLMVHAQFVPFC
jgi:hypothetical protein